MTIIDGAYTGLVSQQQRAPYAHSLSFLVSQVGARSAQLFAQRLAPLGVSPRAFAILASLDSAGGQTQQQLADALGIHRNNMVGLIDEMEAAGWVRRHRSQQDRRAFDVRLTRAGAALAVRISTLIPALDAEIGACGRRGQLAEEECGHQRKAQAEGRAWSTPPAHRPSVRPEHEIG